MVDNPAFFTVNLHNADGDPRLDADGQPMSETYQRVRKFASSQETQVHLIADGNGNEFVLKLFHASKGEPSEETAAPFGYLRESSILQKLSEEWPETEMDPGVPRLFGLGTVSGRPAIIREFIDGENLGDWCRKAANWTHVERVLIDLCRVVDSCHRLNVLHADLSLQNVIIAKNGRVVLIDFNVSKILQSRDRHTTATRLQLPPDTPATHPLLHAEVTQGEMLKRGLPLVDHCRLGLLVREVIDRTPAENRAGQLLRDNVLAFARESQKYGSVSRWETGSLAERFRLLVDGAWVPELDEPSPSNSSVNIATGDSIPLTSRLEALVRSDFFRRMRELKQLSLIRHIHPGAEHSRFEHSLHTYEIARRLSLSLRSSPLYRMAMDEESQLRFLVAALLHDTNHFPFMHYLQEFLPQQFDNEWIINQALANVQDDSLAILEGFGLTPSTLARVAFDDHPRQKSESDQIISSAINSAVDVDKMSYLILDSLHTGVRFGRAIELDTLLRLASVDWVPGNRLHVVFDEKAEPAIQAVLSARSSMFQAVYWHRLNRSMISMIGRDFAEVVIASDNQDGTISSFVADTLQTGDAGAIAWIAQRHQELLGRPALSQNLLSDGRTIMPRILTMKPERSPEVEEQVTRIEGALSTLRGVEYRGAERTLLQPVADLLSDLTGAQVLPDHLLLDVPRRNLDMVSRKERLYLRGPKGVRNFRDAGDDLPGQSSLRRLTRHVRLFAPHEVWDRLSTNWQEEMEGKLRLALVMGADNLERPGGLD